jgi:hypothetical protein
LRSQRREARSGNVRVMVATKRVDFRKARRGCGTDARDCDGGNADMAFVHRLVVVGFIVSAAFGFYISAIMTNDVRYAAVNRSAAVYTVPDHPLAPVTKDSDWPNHPFVVEAVTDFTKSPDAAIRGRNRDWNPMILTTLVVGGGFAFLVYLLTWLCRGSLRAQRR